MSYGFFFIIICHMTTRFYFLFFALDFGHDFIEIITDIHFNFFRICKCSGITYGQLINVHFIHFSDGLTEFL